jgi:hypothetical protein
LDNGLSGRATNSDFPRQNGHRLAEVFSILKGRFASTMQKFIGSPAIIDASASPKAHVLPLGSPDLARRNALFATPRRPTVARHLLFKARLYIYV